MTDSVAVTLPKLSVAMSEGTIVEWLVANGSVVRAGQEIYVVQTDKVESVVESPSAGILRHEAAVGDTMRVGARVASVEATLPTDGDQDKQRASGS